MHKKIKCHLISISGLMNTIDLFTSRSDSQFNDSLKKKSILLIIVFAVFLLYIFRDNYWKVIVLLAASLFLMENYIGSYSDSLKDTNKQTMKKLNDLQLKMYTYVDIDLRIKKTIPSPDELDKIYQSVKLKSMYMDANLISFLESIIQMNEYNPEQFFKLLKGTNTILGIWEDIDRYSNANTGKYPYNTSTMLKIALEIKSNCLNNIHNLIYTIPKEKAMYQYHYDITNRYNELITKVINKIYYADFENIKATGINHMTKFTDYNPMYQTPVANDKTRDYKFIA